MVESVTRTDPQELSPARAFSARHLPHLNLAVGIAILVVLALAAAAVWALTEAGGDGESPAGATLVRPAELGTLGALAGHVVFWAGKRAGAQLEYSHDSAGNVHLRYLPKDVSPAAATGRYPNVGTYPFPDAWEATRRLARLPGLRAVRVPGGTGFIDPERPYSVVLAWASHPDLQVEVYDPVAYRALARVRAGDIVPVP